MYQFIGISRGGYYEYIRGVSKPQFDQSLAVLIAERQQICRRTYGYYRVYVQLQKRGTYRNPKTISRIIQKYSLLAEVRRYRKCRKMGEQLHKYPDLLDRQFTALRPNQKWITDISYIHTGQGVLYPFIIRDPYDNSIVSYKMDTERMINLVLDTIRLAERKGNITAELQLHSDQGSQYTSQAYFCLTQRYGITPSMSRRGSCYDNAMAENSLSCLETECVCRRKIHTFQQARELVNEHICFYSHQRILLKTRLTLFGKRHQFVA